MEILKAFYFILPAYIANMAPVIASRYNWPFAKALSVKHFGKNKTYRGFIFGYIAALLFIIAQKYANIEYLNIIDYSQANLFLIAFLMSFGALGGDLLKSFLKRRKGINPGQAWFPYDQVDLILGALFLTYPFYPLTASQIIALILITPALHILTNFISFKLGLKDVWW